MVHRRYSPELEKMFVTEMKDEEPDLYAALLTNRNANWVVADREACSRALA